MDYAALAQALNLDAQKEAAQNPWSVGSQTIQSIPVWNQNASSGRNIGAMALQGFLGGITGQLGKRDADSSLAARNEALRGFMTAPAEQQGAMLQENQYLKPYSAVIQGIQAEEEKAAKAKAADRQAALQDKLLERQMGIPLLAQEEAIKEGAKAKNAGMVKPMEVATDLRKELMGAPEYKNYSTVVQSAKNIKELAKKNDPVSNLGLIYSTIKLVDPTSAVKEGEVDMVNLSQGPLARMSGEIEYSLQNGGKLQESTRKKLVEMAALFAKTAKDAYKTQESPRLDIAQRYGVNPQDLGLLPDFQMETAEEGAAGYSPEEVAIKNQMKEQHKQRLLASRGAR
jgi:hypothetical protein